MMADWETIGSPGGGGWETVGGSRVDLIPGDVTPPAAAPKAIPFERLIGTGEAALHAVTGIPAALAGNVAGVARTLTSGKAGTDEGTRAGEETARNVSSALTYEPRTEAGKRVTRSVADALDASKLAGLNPFDAAQLARTAAPVAAQARTAAGRGVDLLKPAPKDDMVGVGAAQTEPARLRRERAANLPVPIPLTKGQAERTFEQQRFERETAKMPKEGEPLRRRFAEQNNHILQNFDAWVDQTGAQTPDLRATGIAVTDAVNMKAARAKAAINKAYDEARAAGDMAQKVGTGDLVTYIENNRPEAINAPVLASVEQKLVQLGGAARDESGKLVAGEISINDLEELRKMVGRIADSTPTNMRFGREAKSVIDQITDGKGGEVYRRARRLRTQFASEFENQAGIRKLMATKPGTNDRAVAFEDVFSHSILGGSLDDVRAIRKTLQTAGQPGEQAWRELQGQTVNYVKQQATKGVSRDENGRPIISAAGLDRAVTSLDRDGKLDFVFGKQGAQQIRDINDLAKDVYTSPPGSVNTSNTASVLMAALDSTFAAVSGLPAPAATAVKLGVGKLKSRKLNSRVADALSQDTVDRAGVGTIRP